MNMDAWERMMAKLNDAGASVIICRQALAEAERRAEQMREAVERALEGLPKEFMGLPIKGWTVEASGEVVIPESLMVKMTQSKPADPIEHRTLAENLERAALASQLEEKAEAGHVEPCLVPTPNPIHAKLRPWKTWAANVKQAGGPNLVLPDTQAVLDWWTDQWNDGRKPAEAVKLWQQANTAKALANAEADAARLVEIAGQKLGEAQQYADANCMVDRPDGCRRRPVLADPAAQAAADLPNLDPAEWRNRPARHTQAASKEA